jgi:hypothetical protein
VFSDNSMLLLIFEDSPPESQCEVKREREGREMGREGRACARARREGGRAGGRQRHGRMCTA